METFLDFLREVLKGMVRAISAHFFKKAFFEKEKTTLRRQQANGWFSKRKVTFDNHHPDGSSCREEC
ncbi:hypothetical protein WMZ97_12630 [Lentibacillus sp. N15]|uniref:hypothetical protein n=1 Tax=Lentibacillus songyuanensis TaxID=3136161 RepID=UPI0031BA2D37